MAPIAHGKKTEISFINAQQACTTHGLRPLRAFWSEKTLQKAVLQISIVPEFFTNYNEI